MEREKQKEIQNQFAEKQLADFKNTLPTSESIFLRLFDFLDVELDENGCNHTLLLTKRFLSNNGVLNATAVIDWLADNGGGCDCEVLANVEDKFECFNLSKGTPSTKKEITKKKLKG